jgi:hypothetical protein
MGEDIFELMCTCVESTRRSLSETVTDLPLVTVIIPVRQELGSSPAASAPCCRRITRLNGWSPGGRQLIDRSYAADR